MEPIGTITQYFSFIDSDTRNTLEIVMKEASDYYDFVQRLCDLVLKKDSPVMVVYFAIHHSLLSFDFKFISSIEEKYGHNKILGPNLFFISATQGNYEDMKRVHEMADAVLALEPEDWIALEMNLMKFEADMRNYPKTMYKTSTMERIRELIDSNPRFAFYEIVLNDHLSVRAQIDGDTKEQLHCIEKAIRIARKTNDPLRLVHNLIHMGGVIMNQDFKRSREAFEEAYQIAESTLGVPYHFSNIVYYLGLLDAIRGDFDDAISNCLRAVTLKERAGLDIGNCASFLCIFYNVIGEPESGLEWGRMAEDQFQNRPYLIHHAVLFQIWSLILLKRLIEAEALLDSSRETILKSGNEDQLAWYHFVSGLLEMEGGNLALALSSIEQGLKIYEQQGYSLLMENIFLHQQAKIEILSYSTRDEVSPSLAALEERALSEDLPGVLGQVLLLKANTAILTNDEVLLLEIIDHLELLLEKENLLFLKPRVDGLKKRLVFTG